MIVETFPVSVVAKAKGVSESAIRFALNDPRNSSLVGVRVGRRLMVCASSVEQYTPRKYPRMERLLEVLDPHQRKIRSWLEELAVEVARESPQVAKVLWASIAGTPVTDNGKPGYLLLLNLEAQDEIRIVDPERVADLCIILRDDDKDTVKQRAKDRALQLVREGFIAIDNE